MQMVSILWGDAQRKQLLVLRTLYDRTIPECSLGDWDLGYKQKILDEDGLGALLGMCVCPGRRPPVLPLHILNTAVSDAHTGGVHFTRLAHVLIKLAARCAALPCRLLGSLRQACPAWFRAAMPLASQSSYNEGI